MFLNRKGSITVFLCITIPIILILSLILCEIYSIKRADKIISDCLFAASTNVMSNYSSYLKEYYELYGYCLEDEKINELISKSLNSNLSIDFYDFEIVDIKYIKSKPITDINILKEQIYNIMEDSIYVSVSEELYERISSLETTSKITDLLIKTMEYIEILKSINEKKKLLNELLSTESVDISGYLNIIFEGSNRINEIGQSIIEIESTINEGIYEVNLLLEEKGRIKEIISNTYEQGIKGAIQELRTKNNEALEYIEDIIIDSERLNIISNLIKEGIDKIESCPDYLTDTLEYCVSVSKGIEVAIIRQLFDEMENEINVNISILEDVLFVVDDAYIKILNEESLNISDINSVVNKYYSEYKNNISIDADMTAYGKEEDKRGFYEELGEKVLEEVVGEDINTNSILPSNMKEYSDIELFDVDLSNDDSSSVKNKLGFIGNIVNTIGNQYKESAYINEYLMYYFSNHLSQDFPNTFFDSEIEYVLYGKKSQNKNLLYLKSSLLSFRFGLNTMHVYADGEKQVKANVIATTIAGWWTGGAGIPILSNLILCAWALAESGYDVSKLLKGDAVPMYKLKGDWSLDLGLNSIGPKTPVALSVDYEDYLRIFLLTIDLEDKLLRILDLISLNMPSSIDIYNTYCGIELEVTVSYKSLLRGRNQYVYKIKNSY